MTREQLIKAIYDNEDAWSCPEHTCDMPEKEGNTGECCLKCAEKQLKAYEDKIRADAFDEFISTIMPRMKWGNDVYTLAIEHCIEVAKLLKEQKNDNNGTD